jgi:hypothetical protein
MGHDVTHVDVTNISLFCRTNTKCVSCTLIPEARHLTAKRVCGDHVPSVSSNPFITSAVASNFLA